MEKNVVPDWIAIVLEFSVAGLIFFVLMRAAGLF